MNTPFHESLEGRQLLSTSAFTTTNLISDLPHLAVHQDPQLVNPWGISDGPGKEFWVSDNGTGVSTLYVTDGTKQSLVVSIPGIGGAPGTPDGQLFNSTGQFDVSKGGKTGPAVFIFATEDGIIAGWNPKVDPTHAVVAVNHNPSAVYKGIALASNAGKNELFAANFRGDSIDVFDSNFKPVQLPAGAFHDPYVPHGFAPFNIEKIGNQLVVTYAKPDAAKHDDVAGPGNGYVAVFSTSGKFIWQLPHGAYLNSPWGLAVAPSSFGTFAGDLLVGNFGSGMISAFDLKAGKFAGFLSDSHGTPIHIPGLWGLIDGNGGEGGDSDKVYFTAGLNHENDGLFGSIAIAA